MTTPIKLAVGIPAYGRMIVADHAKMWFDFANFAAVDHPSISVEKFITTNICGVDRARNFLLGHAMSEGCDWLLMIDSDTWVDEPSMLLDMIEYGRRYDAAIIAAKVRSKGGKINTIPPSLPGLTGVRSVDSIGAAVMAIDLHKIGDAAFRFTDELSEDFEFCRQVRTAGGKIFCDGRVRTYHLDRAPVLSSW